MNILNRQKHMRAPDFRSVIRSPREKPEGGKANAQTSLRDSRPLARTPS
jgi:hypothetical protein